MEDHRNRIGTLTVLNEELENYFANTIIPQLFVDAELKLRKFTPPAMKQFKLKNEYVGMMLEDLKENFRYPTITENIKTVIATGKSLEKEIQTTDLHWYQMNILPYLIRKNNKSNGVIITFIDITHRIRDLKEQERLIAEHELLLDTIAHDIKNPLHGLGLTIQMLKRYPDKYMERFPSLVQNVEDSLKEMRKVISDLVESRWQKQKYDAMEEILDLQSILEDVRLTLSPQIVESKAIIKQELGISEITFVRRKLRSVLYNLISNAIKYTPENVNPEVMISSYEKDGYMVIRVADNGIGISKADQDSIFEKFERVRVTGEGTGVGLYLVNTILVKAGGKIEVKSEPNKGSVFSVFLKLNKNQ